MAATTAEDSKKKSSSRSGSSSSRKSGSSEGASLKPPTFVGLRSSGMALLIDDEDSLGLLPPSPGTPESLADEGQSRGAKRRSWSHDKSPVELLEMIKASGGVTLPVKPKSPHCSGPSPAASSSAMLPSRSLSGSSSGLPTTALRTRSNRDSLRDPVQLEECYQRFSDPGSLYTAAELAQPDAGDFSDVRLMLSNFQGVRLPAGRADLTLEAQVQGPDGTCLLLVRSLPVKGTDPKFSLSLSEQLAGCTGIGWLKRSKLGLRLIMGKRDYVGSVSVDLYTLAVGPRLYDLPLLNEKGVPHSQGTRVRVSFVGRIQQKGHLAVNLRNCWATGICPSSTSERTNPKFVAFLASSSSPHSLPDPSRVDLLSQELSSTAGKAPNRPDDRSPLIESSVHYGTRNPRWGELFGGPVIGFGGSFCSLSELLHCSLVVRIYHVSPLLSHVPMEFLGQAVVPISRYFEVGKASAFFECPLVFRDVSYGIFRGEMLFVESLLPVLAPMEAGIFTEEGIHDATLLVAGAHTPLGIDINFGAPPIHVAQPLLKVTDSADLIDKVQLANQRNLLVAMARQGDFPASAYAVGLPTVGGSIAEITAFFEQSTAQQAIKFLTRLLDSQRADLLPIALRALTRILENHHEAQRIYLASPNAIAMINQFSNVGLRTSSQIPRGAEMMADLAQLIGILALHDSVAQQKLADGGAILVLKDILTSPFPERVYVSAIHAIGNLCYGMGGRLVLIGPPPSGPSQPRIGTDHNSDTVRLAQCAEPIITVFVEGKSAELRAASTATLKILLENPENQRVALPILGDLLHADKEPSTQRLALDMMQTVIGIRDKYEASSALLRAVGVEPFVGLLVSPDASLSATALSLLKDHIIDNPDSFALVRQSLLESGSDGLNAYLSVLESHKDPEIVKTILSLLHIACSDPVVASYVNQKLLSHLLTILGSPSEHLLVLALRILRLLVEGCTAHIGIYFIPLLIALTPLQHAPLHRKVLLHTLRLTYSLITHFGSRLKEMKADKIVQMLFRAFEASLVDQDFKVTFELLQIFSVSFVANPDNQKALLALGLVPQLLSLIITSLVTPPPSGSSTKVSTLVLRSVVAIKAIQLLSQLYLVDPAGPAQCAELEPYLVSFILSHNPDANLRLHLEASVLFKMMGYESTGLCFSKMAEPPQSFEYTHCRQCLWKVCPVCRDTCHSDHTHGATAPSSSQSACGCQDTFCRVKKLSKKDPPASASSSSAPPAASSPAAAPSHVDKWNQECPICFDGIRDVMLYKCGHVAACETCARALLQAKQSCPMCHQPILDTVKIYRV